ncbi:hypothetical protein NUSPORA_02893, partial [Nucleospora cyclopteri]
MLQLLIQNIFTNPSYLLNYNKITGVKYLVNTDLQNGWFSCDNPKVDLSTGNELYTDLFLVTMGSMYDISSNLPGKLFKEDCTFLEKLNYISLSKIVKGINSLDVKDEYSLEEVQKAVLAKGTTIDEMLDPCIFNKKTLKWQDLIYFVEIENKLEFDLKSPLLQKLIEKYLGYDLNFSVFLLYFKCAKTSKWISSLPIQIKSNYLMSTYEFTCVFNSDEEAKRQYPFIEFAEIIETKLPDNKKE